jgi:ornithine cyclodeaminase/alanine dehydrogenase-like protein (mu-crystallin family)
MSLLLSDADVRQAVSYTDLADCIEAALKAQPDEAAVVPARMNLEHFGTWLRVMPAIVPSANVMGLKVFHGIPGRGARYLILLYSMSDGSALAAVDACYLTAARTAAASAVASRYLSSQGPVRLGVIGSGLEAETHCRALCAVGEVTGIKVFSPNGARRQAFAERMRSALRVPVTACDRPEDAVADVEHAVVATNTGPSMTVACQADWLSAGQHVTSIGSTNQRLREMDTEIFRRADLIVLDADANQMAEESGDLIQYRAEGGALDPTRTRTLPDLIGGKVAGRERDQQLTLYKSVGTALQDVIAADLVYRRALELGLGVTVTELSQEKQ